MALICDDPDAPMGTWDHWLLLNINPERGGIMEAIPARSVLATGEVHGLNSWGREDYGGPCSPSGDPHRYFFKIYALDTDLNFPPGIRKSSLMERMKGHVVDRAELIGIYSR
jgi:hypothetical protein